jgi:methyltransferase
MDLSVIAFYGLLGVVAALRLTEMQISRRHQAQLAARGARKVPEPHFRWMVLLHGGVLAGAALEVGFLRRPFLPALAIPMGILFLLANIVRWWVIRTMKGHWNIQVMESAQFGVVTSGPFRFIRHPNYAAVFTELVALPLIHTAWLTALLGAVGHVWILSRRLAVEEPVLMGDPAYRATMAHKPRFLPGLF